LAPGNENSLPVPKPGKLSGRPGESRKQAALVRLKVTPEQLAEASDITSVLKDIPRGRQLAFKSMRLSSNPVIKSFLARYDRIPQGDRNYLPIEAVCIAAEVEPSYLLGEILLAMREYVKVVGIGSHLGVMKATIKRAMKDEGFREKEMVHSMLGALPRGGGSTFINKFFAGQPGEEPTEAKPERFEDDLDVIFPDVSLMQERVQPMRQKLLETRK
jgi:hypothetical protein